MLYNEIPIIHSLYGNVVAGYVVCVRCRRCILVAISWLPGLHWVVLCARQHGCPSGDTPIFDRVGPLHWVVLCAKQHGCPSGDTPIFDRVGPLHGFKM